jgi:hypothetical protein
MIRPYRHDDREALLAIHDRQQEKYGKEAIPGFCDPQRLLLTDVQVIENGDVVTGAVMAFPIHDLVVVLDPKAGTPRSRLMSQMEAIAAVSGNVFRAGFDRVTMQTAIPRYGRRIEETFGFTPSRSEHFTFWLKGSR